VESFIVNNGGSIPPNVIMPPDSLDFLIEVLSVPNTSSRNPYHLACKENSIKAHPAVMADALAQFFLKFLTDERDLVLDPFAGSNTTGFVCGKAESAMGLH
jgi:site-specific DNA-methyltransferase (cytosine-N4-specific)